MIELLGITQSQACSLQASVSSAVAPAPGTTALDLYNQQATSRPLRSTLPTLDSCMRRGVPAGSITELVGPAGVGKSQICFQLALLAVAPESCGGLGGACIYIDTERKFSSQRFLQMARERLAPHVSGEAELKQLADRVQTLSPTSTEELLKALDTIEAGVIQFRAALVVVDSIAALARTEFGPSSSRGAGSIVDRQDILGLIAAQLKRVGEAFHIPVVVTNQITTRITGTATAHAFQQQQQQQQVDEGSGALGAALGAKWAHAVNVRLVLQRLNDKRYLKVAKSSACANVALEYAITPRGVEEVLGAPIPEALSGKGEVLGMGIMNEIDYQMMDDR